MLFLHTLSRWRAKRFFSFLFLVWSELALVCEIEKMCWWVDIPGACRFSRAFTACSRSAAHWARRDRGKSNSYTFWPHRRPAWRTRAVQRPGPARPRAPGRDEIGWHKWQQRIDLQVHRIDCKGSRSVRTSSSCSVTELLKIVENSRRREIRSVEGETAQV